MNDRVKILAGLAVFIVLAAFPVWYSLGAAGGGARPDLDMPKDASECVEATAYMTAYHMDLLNQWRDAVVREGDLSSYTSSSGKTYAKSLTKTCMGCHGSAETFCTRCHEYASVAPTCWDCHVEPGGE